MITNHMNGKVYIGSSTQDPYWRTFYEPNQWSHHTSAKNGSTSPLHLDMIKYGIDCFTTKILIDHIDKTQLEKVEHQYIQQYVDKLGRDKVYNKRLLQWTEYAGS
ncbi:hypothetical protein CEW46_32200, partial [Bacillus cereus]